MDLSVEVKEKPTGTFSIGAGYSSVEKITFMGQISENNLFGRGQKLSGMVNLSGISNKFNIDFTEPHIFDSAVLFGFSAYNWEREYDEYTKDSTGGTIRFGYPVWEKWNMNASYGYDDTMLNDYTGTDPEILDSMNYHVTSFIQLALLRDTRNRLHGATDGSRNLITLKYAGGGLLGGDNSFTKIEASSSWYFPVTKKTAFHPKLTGGYVAGNSHGHLPVFEKFYLGGLSTIRSFEYGEISPIGPSGDRIGGDKMWYANFEYLFPLVASQGVTGVIFYDIGNVYGIDEGWDFNDYKHAAGGGFRWMSPIGPLRLEWAMNLDPVGDEDEENWEFSMGGMF